SAVVQALPSLHAVPFGAGGFEHVPVAGLQVAASWHWSSAVQATGVPEHAPARQISPVVQALPSLQLVPFATGWGFGQVPVAGAHDGRPAADPRLTAVGGGARVAVGTRGAVRRRRVRARAGDGIAGAHPVALVARGAEDGRAGAHTGLARVAGRTGVAVVADR